MGVSHKVHRGALMYTVRPCTKASVCSVIRNNVSQRAGPERETLKGQRALHKERVCVCSSGK